MARDATAVERDLSALRRDRAAEARDLDDDEHDAEVASQVSLGGARRATSRRQLVMRSARDRQRAADDRIRSAGRRIEAGRDREHAASDRRLAAGERVHAGAERDVNAIDLLTGARRRGPGLAELQHQIDRARLRAGQLVVAYVEVDGLKETNDSKGHQAGDATLKQVVDVLREHLRSYEPIVRLGGDEFACAMSDTTIENVRSRLGEISVELADGPEDISISVGFAALMPGDTPMDLINRADTSLLRTRHKE
jgi:diguanylate cyclase (GGDEF)-like protein